MNIQEQVGLLRADYLHYCYRAQVFRNSHSGRRFMEPEYESNLEAIKLKEMHKTLSQIAMNLDDPNLAGKTVLSKEFWEHFNYKTN